VNGAIKLTKPHNHPEMTDDISKTRLKNRLKRAASDTNEPLREVFDNISRNDEAATLIGFGDVENLMYK
jgi:hypothetical protein